MESGFCLVEATEGGISDEHYKQDDGESKKLTDQASFLLNCDIFHQSIGLTLSETSVWEGLRVFKVENGESNTESVVAHLAKGVPEDVVVHGLDIKG